MTIGARWFQAVCRRATSASRPTKGSTAGQAVRTGPAGAATGMTHATALACVAGVAEFTGMSEALETGRAAGPRNAADSARVSAMGCRPSSAASSARQVSNC